MPTWGWLVLAWVVFVAVFLLWNFCAGKLNDRADRIIEEMAGRHNRGRLS